ncbi:MAG TPA: methyltransferase [Gemmatimonadaceae bacterium]|jgi:SAM-dependent methyltransferase
MHTNPLSPSARAFDAVAPKFDERFGGWLSVAAQRRAVRAALVRAFPSGSRVLEIGGGTGEDACWLSANGRDVLLTDPSPAMVRIATAKLASFRGPAPVALAAEHLDELASSRGRARMPAFDGAFSNFAALNCVLDLAPVAHALSRLVRPGGQLALVVFGTMSPGEWIVQLARRSPRAAVRRVARGDVPARLGGNSFPIRYHRGRDIRAAFAPYFAPVRKIGIGIFVPPSAAEPWISQWPRCVALLEGMDRLARRPLASLGDHVLYQFERLP